MTVTEYAINYFLISPTDIPDNIQLAVAEKFQQGCDDAYEFFCRDLGWYIKRGDMNILSSGLSLSTHLAMAYVNTPGSYREGISQLVSNALGNYNLPLDRNYLYIFGVIGGGYCSFTIPPNGVFGRIVLGDVILTPLYGQRIYNGIMNCEELRSMYEPQAFPVPNSYLCTSPVAVSIICHETAHLFGFKGEWPNSAYGEQYFWEYPYIRLTDEAKQIILSNASNFLTGVRATSLPSLPLPPGIVSTGQLVPISVKVTNKSTLSGVPSEYTFKLIIETEQKVGNDWVANLSSSFSVLLEADGFDVVTHTFIMWSDPSIIIGRFVARLYNTDGTVLLCPEIFAEFGVVGSTVIPSGTIAW